MSVSTALELPLEKCVLQQSSLAQGCLSVQSLGVSVLQQHVLLLDISVLEQPALALDITVLVYSSLYCP